MRSEIERIPPMTAAKPVLILQLRPEDATTDSEYACILKYGGYATLFHPEGDAEEFILRINTCRNHGHFKPHETDELKSGSA